MRKSLFYLCLLAIFFSACKKNSLPEEGIEQKRITNELNQFKDLKEPISSGASAKFKNSKVSNVPQNTNSNGCVTVLHQQSASFDKLSVLDPASNIMYVGSLFDGNTIQDGTYTPLILSSDYVRKPITFSTTIQGSSSPISKTIVPQLSDFRNAMQEITNAVITGQQPANFTFEVTKIRSKKELAMKVSANLSFGSFFTSIANYDENNTNNKQYYLLKIFQKFFSADIDIPQDGNLFNKPIDYTSDTAPVYVSSIDYGRSAYLLIESSYDSTRVKKSLTVTLNAWKINAGAGIDQESREVTEDMYISGTVIGGSSSLAAQTINGIQAFQDYVTQSGNLTQDSRGAIIAYTLRNAKNHGIYKTVISGDYYITDCSSQLIPIYEFYNGSQTDHLLSPDRHVVDPWPSWGFMGINFYAYATNIPGTIPVYEFYNAKQTDHFLSIDRNVVNGYPNWQFVGPKFYVYPTQTPGTIPVYEFYHAQQGDHLTTANPNATAGFSGWTNYGIKFYAHPPN